MSAHPNVIVLMADTVMTSALGCYGAPYIQTPNIDALARTATLFEQAYQPATMCQPSRISWMTGCYPSTHGIYLNTFKEYRRRERTILRAAHEAGYKGGYLGLFHCWQDLDRDGLDDWSWIDFIHDLPHPNNTSWDKNDEQYREYFAHIEPMGITWPDLHLKDFHDHAGYTDFPIERHPAVRLTDKAIACIDDFAAERPNMLWLSYWMPHEPWAPPAPWHRMYSPADVVLPGNLHDDRATRPPHHSANDNVRIFRELWQADDGQSYRRALAAYAGCMSFVDGQIGRVLDHLKKKSLYDDSLIVFLTDHGTANGAHGWMFKGGSFMIDEISRIPLIIKAPRQQAARRIGEIVSSVDFFPTIMQVTGIDRCRSDGRTLPGLGGAEMGDDAVALGQHGSGSDNRAESARMLRKGRWKYTMYSQAGVDELYDLSEDPLELRNLSAVAGPQRAALRAELIARSRAAGDPFIVR
jgi:arylsulfatase A-like enzyme